MPVSHIGLTVSHLPTSCSFFLSTLQPLGYRFIGQQGNQIGLGIHDADFFLCQETPGVKAGAAHIAFTAPSRTAVRDFYTAALNAGGRPNGAPACRTDEPDHFNAAVLDFDGNSIEVVFRGGPDVRDDGTVIEHSRVITWRRTVSESYRDDRSVVSSRTSRSSLKQPPASVAPSKAPSVAPSAAPSKPPSIARSMTEPGPIPQVTTEVTTKITATSSGDGAAKTIIGTLLGAAAGAAVAYAMVKSERNSAQKEAEFEAFMKAKAQAAQAAQTNAQPQLSMQDPQPVFDAPPMSVHRNIDDAQSQYSTPQARSVYAQRAIEPAPQSYYSPSHISAPPTQIPDRRAIEYAPAYSVAPSQASQSQYTALQRSHTSPEMLALPGARSTVSMAKSSVSRVKSAAPTAAPSSVAPSRIAHSVAPSAVYSTAPSTLISSFVPDRVERRSSEGSVYSIDSHHSSKSKAKSHVSKHSSASKHTSKSRSRAPSPPPEQPSAPSRVASKAASIVGSILGRDNTSSVSKKDDDKEDDDDEFEIDDFDTDTVAPSDSISQVSSSRRSHRSHRSKSKHDGESSVSKHSSASKHSKSSKHSHHSSSKRSHHSRHSEREGSPLSQEWQEATSVVRPSVVSEPSDASTVKPIKPKSSRKDSGTGEYDALFDRVQYGTGSVAALPVRGITPSMIESKKNLNRSIMTYAMGQKLRPFEG